MDTPSNNGRRSRLAFVLPLLLACLAMPVEAAPARNKLNDNAPAGASSFAPAPGISIDKATAIARSATGGRVLSATPRQRSSGERDWSGNTRDDRSWRSQLAAN